MSSRVQHRGSGLAIVGFLLASAIVAGIGGSVTVPSIPGWYSRSQPAFMDAARLVVRSGLGRALHSDGDFGLAYMARAQPRGVAP